MADFKDADEVYAYIGKLFEDLAEDEELPKFQKANTIVQYQYREPSRRSPCVMEEEDGQVDFSATDMEPEVVMTMEADTAHRFWLGKVNVTVALARGQMKAKGPVAKILKLVPLVKPVFPRYRAMLERTGARTCSRPADGGRIRAATDPARGLQGLLPVHRATRLMAGRDLIDSPGFEFKKEGARRSSSSPTR